MSKVKPIINPQRGFMIEKFQPITKLDIELVKQILQENDEIVIGIGSANTSHEPGELMSTGERVEMIDYVLRQEGIDPNQYIIIPVENVKENYRWIAGIRMLCPRWSRVYTRNYWNASMFSSQKKLYNYDVITIEQQKPELDYYALLAKTKKFSANENTTLKMNIPKSAIYIMKQLGIMKRVDAIYNRKNIGGSNYRKLSDDRILILGRFQPFTGVYTEGTGHIGLIKKALQQKSKIVIVVAAAQVSHMESNPLTAGQRIEVIRYALRSNGVDCKSFFIIPVQDIDANFAFGAKVTSLCPGFNTVLAGNDWIKRLFAEGNYSIIPVSRDSAKGSPISGTRVRNMVMQKIRQNHKKHDLITEATIQQISDNLKGIVDASTLEILKQINFFDIMDFLAFAKE